MIAAFMNVAFILIGMKTTFTYKCESGGKEMHERSFRECTFSPESCGNKISFYAIFYYFCVCICTYTYIEGMPGCGGVVGGVGVVGEI